MVGNGGRAGCARLPCHPAAAGQLPRWYLAPEVRPAPSAAPHAASRRSHITITHIATAATASTSDDVHLHTAAPTPRFRHHHHPRAPRRPRPARPMHAGACIIHAEQHLHLCEPASADTLGPPGHTLSQAQVHTWAFLHTDFSLADVCEWGSIMTREAVKATTFHKQAGARGWRPESRSALVAFVPLALSRVQGDPVALGTDRCRALHVALIPIRLRSSLVN